jgi:hypothetical protein
LICVPLLVFSTATSNVGQSLNQPLSRVIVSHPAAVLVVTLVATLSAFGQDRRVIHAAAIAAEPKINDFKGMTLASPLARNMTKVEGFIQRFPDEEHKPTQRTEAYVGYTPQAIYFVFLAFDREPKSLRARLSRREDVDDDDQVGVWLDTFDDHQHAYFFFVNSYGVQQDGAFTLGETPSLSFDTVWDDVTETNDQGYVAIFKLPFLSLRFAPNHDWGVLLQRVVRRRGERDFLPAVPQQTPNLLLHTADLAGISSVSEGKSIQLVPYSSFRHFRGLDSTDINAAKFITSNEPNLGLDAKAVIKNSLVLDATVNPDFGQVESDDPQVTTNQRFEVTFPEKRPFFQENEGYFLTPYNLAFTRRIVDPSFGIRLTGKLRRWSIGGMVANDESPGKIVPAGDPLHTKQALFALARINREFGSDNSVGFVFADRSLDARLGTVCTLALCRAASNWAIGVDSHIRFHSSWEITLQAIRASTTFADTGAHPSGAYLATLQSTTKANDLIVRYKDKSEDFLPLTGTFERPNARRLMTVLTHRFFSENEWLNNHGPGFTSDSWWDQSGTRLSHFGELQYQWTANNSTNAKIFANFERENLKRLDYPRLSAITDFPHWHRGLVFSSNRLSWLNLTTQFTWGQETDYRPTSGVPFLVQSHQAEVHSIIRIGKRLSLENAYLRTHLRDRNSGLTVIDDHTARTKMNLQFSRATSLRIIGQYQPALTNPSLTDVERRKELNIDVLFTVLWHPGTALYLGFNSDRQNYDRSLIPETVNFPGTLRRVPGLGVNSGNQVFVKYSHLFRF